MRSPATGEKIRLPLTEYLKSIPEMIGIRVNEEPAYEVLEDEGNIEIRRYAPMITATVPVHGDGKDAEGEAFRRLAAYIFGENQEGKTLAMTSPVFKDCAKNMTFVLPQHVIDEGAPLPVDKHIAVGRRPEQLVAAIRYSGENTETRYREHQQQLMRWLAENRRYQIIESDFSAEYDPPTSLDATKRNEIHVTVRYIQ